MTERDKLKRGAQLAQQRFEKYKLLLYLFDPDERGLQGTTLFKMMSDFNMGVTKDAFDSYMSQYLLHDGTLDANGLMGALLDTKNSKDRDKEEIGKKEPGVDYELLKDIFDTFDREKKQAVEEKHFRETMKLLQIPLEDNHVMRMYKMFDLSGDDSIDLNEFLEGLENSMRIDKIQI